MYILLSNSQAGPGRTVKQDQEEISCNHVQAFFWALYNIQGSAKRLVRGCEKFILALASHFCLALPGSCLARFASLLADPCTP